MTASTSTSVTALWQLPPTGSRNGIIKGFKLFIKRKGSGDKPNVHLVNASNALVYTKNLTGLQESTEYELQVLAYTSAGDGPRSSVQVVKTLEVGKSYKIFRKIRTHGEDLHCRVIFFAFFLNVFSFSSDSIPVVISNGN